MNGESVYGTEVWRRSGGPHAGPEPVHDGQDKAFTREDFRFVIKGNALYASCLALPEDGRVLVRSLREADASRLPVFHGIITGVRVLGYEGPVRWRRDEEGLHVAAHGLQSDLPVVIRVDLD